MTTLNIHQREAKLLKRIAELEKRENIQIENYRKLLERVAELEAETSTQIETIKTWERAMLVLIKETEINAIAASFYAQKDRIAELEAEIDSQDTILHKIKSWCDAYPLDVFPEPDMELAREALEKAGITLDSVSASNMRHVLKGIKKLIEEGK